MSLPVRIASHPVVLRSLARSDVPRVTELCGDWAVAKMTALIPHPYLSATAESWIADCMRADAAGAAPTYAITRAGDGLLVGAVGLTRSAAAVDSLGYWVGRPYWGLGYATAAARAVIALAFSHLDIDTLHAIHLARNPASGRVMAKCGMSELAARDGSASRRPGGRIRGLVRRARGLGAFDAHFALSGRFPGDVARHLLRKLPSVGRDSNRPALNRLSVGLSRPSLDHLLSWWDPNGHAAI